LLAVVFLLTYDPSTGIFTRAFMNEELEKKVNAEQEAAAKFQENIIDAYE